MTAQKKIKILYFGAYAFSFLSELPSQFEYEIFPADYDIIQDEAELFKQGRLNPKYRKAVFIFNEGATLLSHKKLLIELPSYRLLYSHHITLPSDIAYVLAAKGAYTFDFTDTHILREFIAKQYTPPVYGRKLEMDYIKVSSTFEGQVIKKGHTNIQLIGDFGTSFTQLLSWRMTDIMEAKQWLEAYLEIDYDPKMTDFVLKVYLIEKNTANFKQSFEFTAEMLKDEKNTAFYNAFDEDMYLNFALFVKGSGELNVAHLHVRDTFADDSYMIPGGKAIQDQQNLGMEIGYYFEPADFKPPLAVYFSGYRTAEGFEGKNMMETFGSPYLLISDPRIEGGNFYLGSEALEEEIVSIIRKKLAYLGFTTQDLVLSGLSMGTFGALYYASTLSPRAVIVGKPMLSLGTVALNERIKRSDTFATSVDTLMMNMGEVSISKALEFDERLLTRFKTGDYSQTMFAFAYMKQDDYDDKVFSEAYTFLKQAFPLTKVLHKGLIGRHNDNTPGIVRWFVKQYYNIMETQFARNYEDRGGR